MKKLHGNAGKNNPMYGKKGKDSPFYGKHHSGETKRLLRKLHKGKVLSGEHKRKLKEAFTGDKNHMWKGGKVDCYRKRAHKIWAEYWHEEVPQGYDIHHIDGDYTNNNIWNLTVMTHSAHSSKHNKGRPFTEQHKKNLSKARFKYYEELERIATC